RGPGDGRQHLGRNDVDGRPMALGNGQRMARVHRIDVHEGDGVLVLEQLEAGDLSRDDLAEDAVGVGRMAHCVFSKTAPSSCSRWNGCMPGAKARSKPRRASLAMPWRPKRSRSDWATQPSL